MYHKFKKGKQQSLVQRAITKAGSERRLAFMTNIPKGSIYVLKHEKRNLSRRNVVKFCTFLGITLSEMGYSNVVSTNWGQKKGGMALVRKKQHEGTFRVAMEQLHIASSKWMKKWHRYMNKNELKRYY